MWIIQEKFNTEEWENAKEFFDTYAKALQRLNEERENRYSSLAEFKLAKIEVLDD